MPGYRSEASGRSAVKTELTSAAGTRLGGTQPSVSEGGGKEDVRLSCNQLRPPRGHWVSAAGRGSNPPFIKHGKKLGGRCPVIEEIPIGHLKHATVRQAEICRSQAHSLKHSLVVQRLRPAVWLDACGIKRIPDIA